MQEAGAQISSSPSASESHFQLLAHTSHWTQENQRSLTPSLVWRTPSVRVGPLFPRMSSFFLSSLLAACCGQWFAGRWAPKAEGRTKKVAVVILNFNGENYLKKFLEVLVRMISISK